MRDKVVAAIAGEPRAVAVAGLATRVEVAAVEEAVAPPVVPAVVATAAVADLMAAVGDARGLIREKCTTKEREFLAKCARCSGFDHEESTCSSDAAVLAIELPMSEEDLAVEV